MIFWFLSVQMYILGCCKTKFLQKFLEMGLMCNFLVNDNVPRCGNDLRFSRQYD